MSGKEKTLTSRLLRSISLARRKAAAGDLGMSTMFAIGLAGAALISLLYLAQTSAVATAGYDVKRLQEQQSELQTRNAQLRMRVAQLESLGRVGAEARARLKMGPPDKVLYVPLEARQSFTPFRAGP